MKIRPATRPFAGALFALLIAAALWATPSSARAQMFIVSTNAAGTVSSIGEYTTAGVPMKVPLISGLSNCGSIAVSENNLFVVTNADVSGIQVGTVREYTIAGAPVKDSLVTGLVDCGPIAVSGTNLFVITEVTANGSLIGTIKEYSAVTGALENNSVATGLIQPAGMVASGADLFVAAGIGGTLGEYPIAGGAAQTALVSGLPNLGGIAISGSDLFVSEYNQNSNLGVIGEYTTAGKTVKAALVSQSGDTFLPGGIGISGTDLFVSNEATTGVVAEFNTAGSTINANKITGINPSFIAILPVLLPLPATTLTPPTVGQPGAPLVFTAKQSAPNVSVRIQFSLTPAIEASWTNLPSPTSGALAKTGAGVYGTGAAGTTYYPAGKAVSFRAIASENGYADSISNIVGPFTLDQAALSVSFALTSTSDPTDGLVTHIGDSLTYTFTWINRGDAPTSSLQLETPVPTYIDATSNLQVQFPKTALTLNSGTYFLETTAGANNAKVIWDLPPLLPNSKQSVSLIVKVGSQVRINQDLGLPNNYTVSSTKLMPQPPTPTTGYTSGAANPGSRVEGPISFTMVPAGKTVVPGGLVTYNCVLSNLGSTAVTGAFATVVVPDSLRFALSYTVAGKTISGVTSSAPGVAFGENYWTGSPNPQVVIKVGQIAAHTSVSLGVTFQAEWIDQPIVPTIDYGAAFLDSTSYAQFLSDFNAGGGTEASPGAVDYTSFLATGTPATDKDVVSTNQSGVVNIAVAGGLNAQPLLGLAKVVGNVATDIFDGATGAVNLVEPGKQITFLLAASNRGGSEADDVYIQDALPEHSTFISGTIASSTPSSTLSKMTMPPPILDALGTDGHHHHVVFSGLKLLPNDRIFIRYIVQVDSGAKAPANGTLIDSDASTIGSSSTPVTPPGLYASGPIQVTGTVNLAQPEVNPAIPSPGVSSGVVATANALTAYYAQAATRTKTTLDPFPGCDIPYSIPGEERYYIKYHNSGSVPATGATKIKFPIPANTAFYRASFIALAPPALNGCFPNELIPTGPADSITPPAGANGGYLSTGGTATFTIGSLASGSTGYVMVEVIIGPGAVQSKGALIGLGDGLITINDSATVPHTNQAMMPLVHLTNAASTNAAAISRTAAILQPAVTVPAVPKVGIMRIAPQAVITGSNFDITWVIFNYGDQATPINTIFQFTQPTGVSYVGENHTSLFGGHFYIDTLNPVVGSTEEVIWSSPIPAHSAVAVTYTYTALGVTLTPIVDSSSKIEVTYAGDLYATPANINILPLGTPLPQGTNLQYTVTGRPVSCLLVDSRDVLTVDISAAQDGSSDVVYGPSTEVSGGTAVTQADGNLAVYGASTAIKIGPTTPSTITSDLSIGTSLAPLHIKAATVLVGEAQTSPTLPNALIQTAGIPGAFLVGHDGASIVSQGAGNAIGVNGCALGAISGASIVSQGAGNFSSPAEPILIPSAGGAIVNTNGSNAVASPVGSSAQYVTGNNGIVSQGAGNIVSQGAGN